MCPERNEIKGLGGEAWRTSRRFVHRKRASECNGASSLGTRRLDRARLALSVARINDIGEHITATEQAADEAEQELKTILILHLLMDKIGAEFNGIVVHLHQFGVQVQLPDYGVEGQIRSEDLGADQWQFHEASQCLIGRHTGAVLGLAQVLRVRIVEVHPSAGQLELAPVVNLIKKLPTKTRSGQGRSGRSARRGRRRKRH